MKSNQKQAKFFCESCGEEVNANAKFCNNCGKFFSSVRCPNCGCTGSTREFENGCPECGYAVGKSKNNINYNTIKSNNNKRIFFKTKNKKNNQKSTDSLPLWIYIVAILSLIGILFCVYSCL